ncbi:MAG: malectin domain-containing carbohydrate-binding protein [Bryobacteraceae bacterium]|nr:malectin domain-containing carbohydrate-binding protein [Bryobacteraceae bacterium]
MHTPPYNTEQARREIDAVLSSGIIGSSSRQARLLEYLFSKLSHGDLDDLKEYTIAVDLFDKPANFDQHSDATVRVEAHRLRRKLEKYYATEGRDHALRVLLPPGQYLLEFQTASAAYAAGSSMRVLRGEAEALLKKLVLGHLKSLLIATLALIALAAGGLGALFLHAGRPAGDPGAAPVVRANTDNALPDPEPDAVRILVGQSGEPFVDAAGRRWQRDRYFEGGTVRFLNNLLLPRTGRPQLFQHVREGTFTYRIPLPPGEYELRLYAAEPDDPATVRNPDKRFRFYMVYANGSPLGPSYDINASAGFSADTRSFAGLRPDEHGFLTLRFRGDRGGALVSALELLPMIQGKVRPIRIMAQSDPYSDGHRQFWSPDDYFSGGRHAVYTGLVAGDVDPGVLAGERLGDFEYFIPEPPGEYRATLFFAEVWFGAQNAGRQGVGARVFNVLLNHEVVERDLDLLAQGPPNQLVRRTYRNVRPDSSGRICLTFVSKKNLALIRAIEVVPEDAAPAR